MSFMEDRSGDDIGQRLGLTPGNVRVVRHRALGKLLECVESGGGS
jgi:DNA-directed RNA polymerase specialized sigma24 family protein